ncbi:MAG TPA: DNA-3-methyladenine glycosylase I [Virgibacillus sp.]|nr:DNA-3-methyladenine glycosylase I [Virgibacillus sp.]
MRDKRRCSWVTDEPIYIKYHDEEWGKPVYEDQELFEMLSLEGAQAGLSWITILKRRESYRIAFDQFHPKIVRAYDEGKVQSLLQNEGIIRNQLKIRSVITNAEAFLHIQEEFGSFSAYIWQFVDGRPMINNWRRHEDVPASTEESERMSKDLKKRGFKFIGPVICYAFMQAIGMVNDHTQDCWLYSGE